jgi:hypothetical protein
LILRAALISKVKGAGFPSAFSHDWLFKKDSNVLLKQQAIPYMLLSSPKVPDLLKPDKHAS